MKPIHRPLPKVSRRQALSHSAVALASMYAVGDGPAAAAEPARPADSDLAAAVAGTKFVDTHEHLVEEERRTQWKPIGLLPCNDWALLFSHYLNSDLRSAGMSQAAHDEFLSPDVPAGRKWSLLEPFWKAVRNTGYGRALRVSVRQLYGIAELDAASVPRLDVAYRELVKPGFYRKVLQEVAGLESCQVNSLEAPFMESRQPRLLMQDLSLFAFSPYGGRGWTWMTDGDGRKAGDLAGYHRVIDSWIARYAPYAVAAKSQVAYARRLNFADVPAEQAEAPFLKLLNQETVSEEERQRVDDHLFWYGVRKATAAGLPVKLHTGYYAGQNSMPLGRVQQNPSDLAEVLRRAPDTTFVIMHIGYPYQEEMIALAKHFTNAVIDLCWAWIINPVASETFVRHYLAAAPANKLLTFGGDYIPVELVVGHAAIARQGLTAALTGLVAQDWVSRVEAVELVEPLMRGNARRIFRLDEKERALAKVPWTTS